MNQKTYKPSFLLRAGMKVFTYTAEHGYKTLVIAALAVLAVLSFVTVAAPALGAHIIHDILTGK